MPEATQPPTLEEFGRGSGETGSTMDDPGNPSGRRSTSRQSEGTACDLTSATRRVLSGLAFEVSIGACVIRRSTIYKNLPCPSHIELVDICHIARFFALHSLP